MPRKRLKVKQEKKNRIKLKLSHTISDLFDLGQPLYYSGFALTDDYNVVLFFIDNDFLEKNNLTNQLNTFNLNENDLQIKFDKQKILKPDFLEDSYIFNEIGKIEKNKLNWFFEYYPECAFYPITEWFGKSVNTLVIVLKEQFGKVVGVVKTH
jgi:hypothetical protein